MFVVVSYDISDDNKRRKIAEILKDYGARVQYSVFECNLDKKQLRQMIKELLSHVDKDRDSLRIYYLCESCISKLEVYGSYQPLDESEWIVV